MDQSAKMIWTFVAILIVCAFVGIGIAVDLSTIKEFIVGPIGQQPTWAILFCIAVIAFFLG